ncbi:hypothetical protein J7337_000313 [Fusarium musae]|uniref:Uncharacterized protein n=1 Tax=Fusarium musae TaxID=1042133 RepID=A0A9P8DRJ7_9HYPO|nr:hypothetical protein J7337_000313 [Fusarium musae]KAG9506773.1 hypothetical protein J7337_000313 [Fusarium musae]
MDEGTSFKPELSTEQLVVFQRLFTFHNQRRTVSYCAPNVAVPRLTTLDEFSVLLNCVQFREKPRDVRLRDGVEQFLEFVQNMESALG